MIIKQVLLWRIIPLTLVTIVIIIGGIYGERLGRKTLIHSESLNLTPQSDQIEQYFEYKLPRILQINITAATNNSDTLNFTLIKKHDELPGGTRKDFSLRPGASLSEMNDSFFKSNVPIILFIFKPEFNSDHDSYQVEIVIQGRTYTLTELLFFIESPDIAPAILFYVGPFLILILIISSFLITLSLNIILTRNTRGQFEFRCSHLIFTGFFFVQLAYWFNVLYRPLMTRLYSVGYIQIHIPIYPLVVSFIITGWFLLVYGSLRYNLEVFLKQK